MPKVVNPKPVNTRRFRDQRRRHVTARSRGLQQIIAAWLLKFAEGVVEEELSNGVSKGIGDAQDRAMKRQLAEILRIYGLRQLADSGKAASGVTPMLSGRGVLDFMESKDVLVQNLADQTRGAIRGEIRQIIIGALAEVPRPSVGEISRRIRGTYLAPAVGDQPPFVVSSERAMLIARTELVQAENTGIVEGYKAVGVEEMEWLAYSDGKSGDRHHEEMNGKTAKVGEGFTTPLGKIGGYTMLYPGDPAAPIKDTANCRCTVAPVRRA